VVAGFVGTVFVLVDGFEKCGSVAIGHDEFDRQRSTHFHTGFNVFYSFKFFY
jgi:hypothetical protein